jgi:phosphoribosylformylglycinamidine cyclo-ligase
MVEKGRNITYRDAGVDIDAASSALDRVKEMVSSTFNPQVLSGIGHFGTLFDLSGLDMDAPVLVASADGVGTKLKVAFMADRHDTVGMDLVNHCTNDILVQGAKPLFFLDYIACGKFAPRVFEGIVKGLTDACRENGLALVGGETAEMPGFYPEGEYDLAGFIVGAVDRSQIVDGSRIQEGDVLLGLRSSGLHTNGYSMVRKVLFDMEGLKLEDRPGALERPLGEELLRPHRSYLKAIQALKGVCDVKGMAHITGGGLTDNIPRILPDGLAACIRFGSWPVPPIFKLVVGLGGLSSDEGLRVFNMGVGFVLAVGRGDRERAMEAVAGAGFEPDVIGDVVAGNKDVVYEGL